MFQVLCLMVLKLVTVSKNNLGAFSLPPLILKFISSSYSHKETSKRSCKLFLQGSNHGHVHISKYSQVRSLIPKKVRLMMVYARIFLLVSSVFII